MREAQAFGKQASARPAVTHSLLWLRLGMRNARCVARGPRADAGLRKRKTEAFQEPALSEAGGTRGPTGGFSLPGSCAGRLASLPASLRGPGSGREPCVPAWRGRLEI